MDSLMRPIHAIGPVGNDLVMVGLIGDAERKVDIRPSVGGAPGGGARQRGTADPPISARGRDQRIAQLVAVFGSEHDIESVPAGAGSSGTRLRSAESVLKRVPLTPLPVE